MASRRRQKHKVLSSLSQVKKQLKQHDKIIVDGDTIVGGEEIRNQAIIHFSQLLHSPNSTTDEALFHSDGPSVTAAQNNSLYRHPIPK